MYIIILRLLLNFTLLIFLTVDLANLYSIYFYSSCERCLTMAHDLFKIFLKKY